MGHHSAGVRKLQNFDTQDVIFLAKDILMKFNHVWMGFKTFEIITPEKNSSVASSLECDMGGGNKACHRCGDLPAFPDTCDSL